jgi:hypothetical protein
MYKPSFAEPSKKAEASEPLKALFKINAGLRELQESKQPELNQSAPSVAQQIQQQGIAALNSPEAPGEAIQMATNTPMGKMAMQANVANQIKAAEQARAQQALMQMASQQPQPMARGGIAALSANNMKFQRGGVVGFNGEDRSSVTEEEKKDPSFYERLSEDSLLKKAVKFLSDREKATKAFETREQPDALWRGPPIATPQSPTEQLRAFERQQTQSTPQAAPQVAPQAAPQAAPGAAPLAMQRPNVPMARPSPSAGGLGSLMPALGKVDLSGFEADKQAALAAARKQEENLPAAYTMQKLKAEKEAAAKDFGVDLYGAESKARIAALEKEFADQSAARAEANKSRGMDNLITMLTNSGGAPTLFAGLAKGTQAYQAAERMQKAEDLVWGGKKLEFMEKMGAQRDLLNERNKAMMLGDLATVRDRDEKIRTSKNDILQQLSSVYTNSMAPTVQARIHEATNATNLAISQQRKSDEAANRAAMREGQEFSAIQSRITQNAQTSANIIKAMQSAFETEHGPQQKIVGMGVKLPGDAQKRLEEAQAAHKAEIAKEIQRAANENYKLEHYQWLRAGKAAGQPEPVKPSGSSNGSGGGRPGYSVVP